jgi:PAS domain S-box-containing protein
MNDLIPESALSPAPGTHSRTAHEHPPESRSSGVGETLGNARRQAALVALGRQALAGGSLESLLDAVAGEIARVMGAEFSKVAERLPDGTGFLIRAGRGWKPGVMGRTVLGGDFGSATGYIAAKSSGPVIVEDIRLETRFTPPPVLLEHGVVSGISVIIPRGEQLPYGVLGVYTASRRDFTSDDVEFLTGAATLLSFALQRIQAEEALKATESRYRLAVRATNDAVWDWDIQAGNVEWGEGALRLFGHSEEQLRTHGNWWTDHVHPEDRDRVWEGLQAVIDSGGVRWADEYRYRRADGTYAFVSDRGFLERDASGHPIRMIGAMADTTDRQREEEEIRRRVRQEAALANLGLHALLKPDLEALFNDAVRLVAGALDVEFANVLEFRPDSGDFLLRAGVGWREGLVGRASVPADLTSQAGHTYHTSRPRMNGNVVANEPVIVEDMTTEDRFHGPALLIEHGVMSGMSVLIHGEEERPFGILGAHSTRRRSFSRDDAHFLQAVANVLAASVRNLKTEEALRTAEKRFRLLTETIPQIVWTADPNGTHTYFNRRWFEYTHMDKEIALTPGAWTSILPPEDREDALRAWNESVRRGEPYSVERRYVVRAGGGYRWHLVRAVPVRDERGRIIQWFGTSTDVNDQKVAEQKLQELNETLEHRVEERTRSLIRNQRILRKTATQLALVEQKERRRLASDLHDYLAQLLVAAQMKLTVVRKSVTVPKGTALLDQLDEMIRESLTYTRTLIADLSPSVLYDHGLPAALTWLAGRMAERGLTVEVERHGREVPLPEDRAVVTFQAVRELLFNVVKHAGVDHARVRLEYRDHELEVVVSDRGPGLPPTVGDRDPVTTGRFGLINIRERVAGTGGRFEIGSGPEGGTRAQLILPVGDDDEKWQVEPEDPARPAAEPVESDDPRQNSIRVVLADDHARVREGLRATIESFPRLRVVGEARDGAEAVELARVLHPNVVVMDVNMPRMNGIVATRLIRDTTPQTRVVAISVQDDRETETQMREAGAVAYVTKGSDLEVLGRAILAAAGEA